MILTITLNPCIDKSSTVGLLKPESKLRCTEVLNEPGGGGINVSKALKKLESSSVALFPAGGHNGNMLCSLLKEEGILFHAVDTKVETRENWIILETSANNQYRFTFPGREVVEDTIKKLDVEIADNDGVVLRDTPLSNSAFAGRWATLPLRAIETAPAQR